MLMLPATLTIYVSREPADMRKSIDGLSALVQGELKLDPKQAALFVFFNRRYNMVKILYWDRNGFAVWCKRLARGRYRLPVLVKRVNKLSVSDLSCLLEGIDLLDKRRHAML
jgi:transposase